MTTMTPTKARANLSSILKKALDGDDIGIVVNGKIVALRPVEVISTDYAEREYGIKPGQGKAIAQKLRGRAEKAVKTKKSKTLRGSLEALLADRD
ncbi:MAG TPA: hypothetical protein VIM58_11745 [Candidatus Methylacidiphilales bacterium]